MSERVEIERALLERLLAALEERRPAPGPADVIGALSAVYGPQLFTTAEAIRHATARPSPLRNALAMQLRKVTARSLGRFLSRHEGEAFGGLSVHRVGEESAGVIWRVVKEG